MIRAALAACLATATFSNPAIAQDLESVTLDVAEGAFNRYCMQVITNEPEAVRRLVADGFAQSESELWFAPFDISISFKHIPHEGSRYCSMVAEIDGNADEIVASLQADFPLARAQNFQPGFYRVVAIFGGE